MRVAGDRVREQVGSGLEETETFREGMTEKD